MLTPEKQHLKNMDDHDYEVWYMNLPPLIKELAEIYPYGIYKIKDGAPYKLTCPGSIVGLISFSADGRAQVGLLAKDKLPACIEHEKFLCKKYNKNFEESTKQNITTFIDPQYLEPYDKEEATES